jgi:hypothetical protein
MSKLHYPAEKSLQTGDLLFPKSLAKAVPAPPQPLWASHASAWTTLSLRANARATLGVPGGREKMVDFLDPELVQAARDRVAYDVSALLAPPRVTEHAAGSGPNLFASGVRLQLLAKAAGGVSPENLALAQEMDGVAFELLKKGAAQTDEAEDPVRIALMFFILTKAFGGLIDDWLKMPVFKFVQHPLCDLLTGALRHSADEGFFVGHVAMVLRETDGAHDPAGKLWVIEANATDYAHYSVSVHPYFVADEGTAPLGQRRVRGWLNRRLALGEAVWCSRHEALQADDGDAAAGARVEALRARLVPLAKQYLGRRYGFFDNPDFGETGRFYCAEFVHRVFWDLGDDAMGLDQHCQWEWLLANSALLGSEGFVERMRVAVHADGFRETIRGKPFFLLTLPMLYACQRLVRRDASGTPAYMPQPV